MKISANSSITLKRNRATPGVGKRGRASVPRERILNAAARLFRERGYQRTTVRDIASAVGILSGSLFHHFRSKEEMLIEIMRNAAITVCLRGEELASRKAPPLEQLRALIQLELGCVVGEPTTDYHGVLFFEWREVPKPARPELTTLRRRYRRTWRAVLDACARDGSLRCQPDAAVHVLHGAIMGAMTWFKSSGRYSLEEYGEILVALMRSHDPSLDARSTVSRG